MRPRASLKHTLSVRWSVGLLVGRPVSLSRKRSNRASLPILATPFIPVTLHVFPVQARFYSVVGPLDFAEYEPGRLFQIRLDIVLTSYTHAESLGPIGDSKFNYLHILNHLIIQSMRQKKCEHITVLNV